MSERVEAIPSSGESRTETDPRAEDFRLRGRTYAITFDRVWKAAMGPALGSARGWEVLRSDDREGVIEAERRRLLGRGSYTVEVRITLDENAQTRVDWRCRSTTTSGMEWLRTRIIARLTRALDRELGAGQEQILDPTRPAGWIGGEGT